MLRYELYNLKGIIVEKTLLSIAESLKLHGLLYEIKFHGFMNLAERKKFRYKHLF